MKTFSKIFIKASKFFFFIFGAIAAVICLALGAVGTYKSSEAKNFVNSTIETSTTTLSDVETKLTEFENILNDPNSSVNDVVETVKNFVQTTKTTLDNQITQLTNMANQLKTLAEKETNDSVKNTLLEAEKELNNLIKLIGNPSDNTTDSVYGIINEIVNLTNENGNIEEIKDKILTLLNKASSYIDPINNYLSSWDENKVNQTYDTTTSVLLGVGAALLGLAIFGAVLSLILYKRADGKLINRFRSKKEVIHHVEKILKKYPDVKKYLGKGA